MFEVTSLDDHKYSILGMLECRDTIRRDTIRANDGLIYVDAL